MRLLFIALALIFIGSSSIHSQTPEISKEVIADLFSKLKSLSTHPIIVSAVKKSNARDPLSPTSQLATELRMTNEKWKPLPPTHSAIKNLTTNEAAQFLAKSIENASAEFFLNNKFGEKVALSAKTTSWNHKGKEKHEVPLSGRNWTGKPELDESTGQYQLQIAFPIVSEGKTIGSLVIGFPLINLIGDH